MTPKDRNLAVRVGTAVVLLPLVLWLLWLGGLPFAEVSAAWYGGPPAHKR